MNAGSGKRILIEPSGVGKLSDVMQAVQDASEGSDMALNTAVAVVDASKCKLYMKNFGEFFINQIECAGTIILTRTDKASQQKIAECVEILREHNPKATIITTPLAELDGKQILATIEGRSDLQAEILAEFMREQEEEEEEHEHHHHHHDDDEDEHDHEHHHHHHHDDDDEDEHEHHHHHHHDDDHDHEHAEVEVDENGNRIYKSHSHHHHHHHHGGHDADEIFASWGMETPARYSEEEIRQILAKLDDAETYGFVLRSKGMVPDNEGRWIHFDYVPEETEVRFGAADVTGKICVIGSGLKENALADLFRK